MNLCKFGCGQEGIHQFKNGKWCCSKSQNSCPKIKSKNGGIFRKGHIGYKSEKGKKFTEEHKNKLSISHTGNRHSEEQKKKNSSSHIKRIEEHPEEKERLKKISIESNEKIKNDPFRSKKKSEKLRSFMLNGGAIKALKGNRKHSKPELKLRELTREANSFIDKNIIIESPYYIHNYEVDIAIPECKLIIEYDGWFWHLNKEKDLKKQQKLEEEGWKFIRYKGKMNKDIVPSKEQLLLDIQEAIG
jgi:very-short-patch-repair endonuclease